jgi:ATP-binding cassette, subfamily B, bacterial MsbA
VSDRVRKRDRKKGRRGLKPVLQLLPFLRPYLGLVGVLLVVTVCFAVSDAGRAQLVKPLLNTVLSRSSQIKAQAKDELYVYGLPEDLRTEVETRALVTLPAGDVDALRADVGLGGVAEVGSSIPLRLGELLAVTGDLLLLTADGIPRDHEQGWEILTQAVDLQTVALGLAATPPGAPQATSDTARAALLSMRARGLAHDATYRVVSDTLWEIFWWAFGLAIGLGVFGLLMDFIGKALEAKVYVDLQNKTAAHLLTLPIGFFETGKRGDLLSRLFIDLQATAGLISILTNLITRSIHVGILGAWAVWISWQLTLSLVFLAGPVIYVVGLFGKKIRRAARKRQKIRSEGIEAMQQMFSGFREVKAFQREEFEVARFKAIADETVEAKELVIRARVASKSFGKLVNDLLAPVLFLGGGYFVVTRVWHLDVGDFGAFLALMALLYMPAKIVNVAYNNLMNALPSLTRVNELFDQKNDLAVNEQGPKVETLESAITFEDVSFHYTEEQSVLKQVSFEATAGSLTAVVGPTGSGKSTLVDLIMRVRDPSAGRVLVDGVDLGTINLDSYRGMVAVVPQESFLFNDTVRQNIRYGRGDATDEEVEEAARAACIHDEILAFSEGYETSAGERGGRLSGGQIQRIAIARAMLKRPSILILDEAASALDTKTERLVQEALERVAQTTTTFVVAHRLTTIQGADQILVLSKGSLVEHGTHTELLDAGGVYAGLVERQLAPGDSTRLDPVTDTEESKDSEGDSK